MRVLNKYTIILGFYSNSRVNLRILGCGFGNMDLKTGCQININTLFFFYLSFPSFFSLSIPSPLPFSLSFPITFPAISPPSDHQCSIRSHIWVAHGPIYLSTGFVFLFGRLLKRLAGIRSFFGCLLRRISDYSTHMSHNILVSSICRFLISILQFFSFFVWFWWFLVISRNFIFHV